MGKFTAQLRQKMPALWRMCSRNYSNTKEPKSSFRCRQGCSGAGMHGNAVPINILAWERRSHKCVSCKWEHWCYSVPINISNSRSFSFTYGHGCWVCRDSPTWNMQQVHQLAFNWLPTIINTVKYKHVVLSIYAYTYSLTYLNTAGERRRQMTSTLFVFFTCFTVSACYSMADLINIIYFVNRESKCANGNLN